MKIAEGNKLVGFSLSSCVRDIITGKVNKEDVIAIYSNTALSYSTSVQVLIDGYCKTDWYMNPEMAAEIILEWWEEGKIVQPRLIEGYCYYGIGPVWTAVVDLD